MDTVVISSKHNTLFIKKGRLFTGSTYDIAFDESISGNATLRLYFVPTTVENAVCVAETVRDASTSTFTLALNSEKWHTVFEANGHAETMHLKGVLYNEEGDIIADGTVVVTMSPTKAVYDGRPVDVVGPKGDKGDRGEPGKDGDKGEQGDKGDKGEQGDKGDKGKDGVIYTPTLRSTSDGVYVDWTDNNGNVVRGTINIRGIQGLQGPEGKQGDKGEHGLAGKDGAKGEKGDVGKDAYAIALDAGYKGTREEYLALLVATAELPAIKTAVETLAATVSGQAEVIAKAQSETLKATMQSRSAAAEAKDAAKRAEEVVESVDNKITSANTVLDTKITSANSAIDGKVEQAEQAKTDAVKAKNDSVTAKGQAEEYAKDASTSASNASTSATNAKTSEDNAKASATQAENATALKVDQRINTADDSEYPLIVMVDKDVYKFIAPKGLTNSTAVHYCCDGTAHYFVTGAHFYEYDADLKFVKRVAFNFGYVYYGPTEGYRDFVTRMGDYYYLWSRAKFTISKVTLDGTIVASAKLHIDESDLNAQANRNFQVCRNERSGHIVVLGTNVNLEPTCWVYDENLVELSSSGIDCVKTNNIYFYHFNIPDNVTLVAFAPTDTTKNGVYYLDENDKFVEIDVTEIRASGAFTSEDLTKTGRTSANYSIPMIFYEIQYRGQYHVLRVFNGAKIIPLIVHPKEEGKPVTIEHKTFNGSAIGGVDDAYIKEANVPNNRLTATSVVMSNGKGSYGGGSTYSQPFACIANAIVTKPYQTGNSGGAYTDFAPDPMENSASLKIAAMSNTHPVYDKTSVTNKWHLYPAGDYSNIGGAIMFTV